ncbi:MAG TPA: hypothetical protein VK973_09540, partial [Arenicellales bacterium]|nr:hypothetical protein [Arenicellales bacterium]
RHALSRMASVRSPEEALWLQVILQAVNDFNLPNEAHGPTAPARYFTDPARFDPHAEMAGLDPDAVRDLLRVARLIGPDARGVAA